MTLQVAKMQKKRQNLSQLRPMAPISVMDFFHSYCKQSRDGPYPNRERLVSSQLMTLLSSFSMAGRMMDIQPEGSPFTNEAMDWDRHNGPKHGLFLPVSDVPPLCQLGGFLKWGYPQSSSILVGFSHEININ